MLAAPVAMIVAWVVLMVWNSTLIIWFAASWKPTGRPVSSVGKSSSAIGCCAMKMGTSPIRIPPSGWHGVGVGASVVADDV